MPGSAASRYWRRLLAPWEWLVLFLQGKRRRVRIVTLPDGNTKKKTVVKRQWPGLSAVWHNHHYRVWTCIWLLFVLIFAVIVFGEPLLHPEQNVRQAIFLWGVR